MENISLPSKIETQKIDANTTKFIFEPLYPGYGMTVGNALRRVLLSSLPGAAVQAVKIKGVDHEFSTIPNVKEDVVSILLNLKQLRFKFHGDEPVVLSLKAKGEKQVTAADIKPTAEVEVVNGKQHIAVLTDKAAILEMDITVGPGRGYVPVEMREKEVLDIGTIAIDAIYTPIKNVNFTIENVRVEQMTNYDRLILEIATDGTISAEQALKMAAQTLLEHFEFVKNLKSSKADESAAEKSKTKKEEKEIAAAPTDKEGEKEKVVKKKRGRPKKAEDIT
ncbi:MAG: DNA-directed RNA polymerase subunit alpha [Patescibacteria group bacterium]